MYVPTESEVSLILPIVAIAPFIIPLLGAAGGALSNIFGGNQQQRDTQTSSTSTFDNTLSDIFNRTTTEGFAPGFGGTANQALQGIFSRMPSTGFDPSLLDTQETAARGQVNNLASNVFNTGRTQALRSGLGNSPSANILAAGMAENFRGQGLSNISQNFAQQRFNLPAMQENLLRGQRADLANIFRLLPRTQTTGGESTRTSTGTQASEGVNAQTAGQGNFLSNLLGGLVGGGALGLNLQDLIFGNNSGNSGTTDLGGFFGGITGR